MWTPDRIEARTATLDFTSSGQGQPQVRQLVMDGELVANAIGFTGWGADPFQPIVCGICGIEGCEPGNWLVCRRASDFAVMIPDFAGWSEDRAEACPPNYLRSRGTLLLTDDQYRELRGLAPDLPPRDRLKGLRAYELARMLQFEAVHHGLGTPLDELRIRRDHIVAFSEGLADDGITLLEQLLAELSEHGNQPVRLTKAGENTEPLSFFLADAMGTEWTPLARTAGTIAAHFPPGIVGQLYRGQKD